MDIASSPNPFMPTELGFGKPTPPQCSSKDIKGAKESHPAETIVHIFTLLQEGLLEARDAEG